MNACLIFGEANSFAGKCHSKVNQVCQEEEGGSTRFK